MPCLANLALAVPVLLLAAVPALAGPGGGTTTDEVALVQKTLRASSSVGQPLPKEAPNEPLVSCQSVLGETPDGLEGPIGEAGAANPPQWIAKYKEAFESLCASPDRAPYAEVFLDKRFRTNYHRVYGKDGWIDQAWVNFMKVGSDKPDDYFGVLTEKLVDSVHRFSKKAIIVVNFGSIAPGGGLLDPKKYPRLVLLHARGYGPEMRLSFNFNKLRAALFARAKVGASLDSDMMMVGPQADQLLKRTQEEITEEYPFPMMPTHFLDRDPRDAAAKYGNFLEYRCAGCPEETMRWGQAQPTWTFWSLPFLSKWYTSRVEHKKEGQLRVGDIGEDEDLLNVALWKEGATKAWCLWQMGGTSFVWENYFPQHPPGPYPFYSDPRGFPTGVPIAFYFAHAEKKPEKVDKALALLQESDKAKKKRPKAYYHNGTFYDSFPELKKANPRVPCIL